MQPFEDIIQPLADKARELASTERIVYSGRNTPPEQDEDGGLGDYEHNWIE